MGRIEDIDARLNSRMDAMNKRLSGRMSALDAKLGRSSMVEADHLLVDEDRWNFDDEKIVGLWKLVRSSELVRNNDQYRYISGGISFKVLHSGEKHGNYDGDLVNAFAEIDNPVIYLCSGAVRYSMLMAAAHEGCAVGIVKKSFAECFRDMAVLLKNSCSLVPLLHAEEFAKEHGFDNVLESQDALVATYMLAEGTLMGVIAHELGHQVLGHCRGSHGGNSEISRNQEREADSFASSINSASMHKEVIGLGTIIWGLAMAVREYIVEEDLHKKVSETHPSSLERLFNFIKANPTTVEKLGVSFDDILNLLAEAGIDLKKVINHLSR